MELKYVGPMPVVSDRGIGFDQTKPDKFTFLNAAVELLEALSFGPTETTKHLHKTNTEEYSADELLDHLKKNCSNIEEVFSTNQAKTDLLKEELIKRVNENKNLNENARKAWLKNIELMSEYYYQYVTNELAYKCALDALGQAIHEARIKEVTFPMFKNYGFVVHDLLYVLGQRKSPIDGILNIDTEHDGVFGKLSLSHR